MFLGTAHCPHVGTTRLHQISPFMSCGVKPEFESFLLLALGNVIHFVLLYFFKSFFSLSETERFLILYPYWFEGEMPAGPQLRAGQLSPLFSLETPVALLGWAAAEVPGPLCPSVLWRAPGGRGPPPRIEPFVLSPYPRYPHPGLEVLRLNPAHTPGNLTILAAL